jgi:hypothetical protein
MVPMFYLKIGVVEQLLLNYVKFDLNIFYHQSDQTSHFLLFNLQRQFFHLNIRIRSKVIT